jgi:acyl-CoA synthetase (AMP-forming)/AMP-acid ligase II
MGVSTGTAPIPASTLAWLRTVFPDVAEGYGATEVGAITHDDIIVPGVAVKLKDVDGTGWHSGTLPFPTGEVWVRTAAMSSEYLGDAMETDERFDADGFFNTGDIGELDAVHRKLRLIGRSKRYAVGSRLSRFFFFKKTIYLFCISLHTPQRLQAVQRGVCFSRAHRGRDHGLLCRLGPAGVRRRRRRRRQCVGRRGH